MTHTNVLMRVIFLSDDRDNRVEDLCHTLTFELL